MTNSEREKIWLSTSSTKPIDEDNGIGMSSSLFFLFPPWNCFQEFYLYGPFRKYKSTEDDKSRQSFKPARAAWRDGKLVCLPKSLFVSSLSLSLSRIILRNLKSFSQTKLDRNLTRREKVSRHASNRTLNLVFKKVKDHRALISGAFW